MITCVFVPPKLIKLKEPSLTNKNYNISHDNNKR